MSTLTDPENAAHDRTIQDDIERLTQAVSSYPYDNDDRTAQEMARHMEAYPWLYNEAGDYDPRFQNRPELEANTPDEFGILPKDRHMYPWIYPAGQMVERTPPDMNLPTSIHEEALLDEDKMYQLDLNGEDVAELKGEYVNLEPIITTNKHMTQAEALNHQQQMFDDALLIMQKKRHDYSGTIDPFKNLRDAAFVGVNPLQGVMVRIMDKFARIRSFIEEGTLKVNDESTRDTLVDVLNYTCILAAMIEEQD